MCFACKSYVVFALLPAQCAVCCIALLLPAQCAVCKSCAVFPQCTASEVCNAGAMKSPLTIFYFAIFLLFLPIPTSWEWMSMGISIITTS